MAFRLVLLIPMVALISSFTVDVIAALENNTVCVYTDDDNNSYDVPDEHFIWINKYRLCKCKVNPDYKLRCVKLTPKNQKVKDAVNLTDCDTCPKVITMEEALIEVKTAISKLKGIQDDANMAPYVKKITRKIARLESRRDTYIRQLGKQSLDDEKDPCEPNPCQNGGTCTADESGFTCACSLGFSGSTCETKDPCEPNPCQNGGTCTADESGFTCACSLGFSGSTCETTVDPCVANNPCQHGGTCLVSEGSVQCDCDQYWGEFCEINPIRLADGPKQTRGRLEIYYNDQWGAVCKQGFDYTDARIVCNQLGYAELEAGVVAYSAYYKMTYSVPDSYPIWLDKVACQGTETALSDCPASAVGNTTCSPSEIAVVACWAS